MPFHSTQLHLIRIFRDLNNYTCIIVVHKLRFNLDLVQAIVKTESFQIIQLPFALDPAWFRPKTFQKSVVTNLWLSLYQYVIIIFLCLNLKTISPFLKLILFKEFIRLDRGIFFRLFSTSTISELLSRFQSFLDDVISMG